VLSKLRQRVQAALDSPATTKRLRRARPLPFEQKVEKVQKTTNSTKKQTWHARAVKIHPRFKDWPSVLQAQTKAEAKAKKAIQEPQFPFEEIPSPSYVREENVSSQETPKLSSLHKALADWTARTNKRKAKRSERTAASGLERLPTPIRSPKGHLEGLPGISKLGDSEAFKARLEAALQDFERPPARPLEEL
jgi:hypothetical protein